MDNNAPSPRRSADSAGQASPFPVLVYCLCGLIILVLAGLWLTERRARIGAQVRLGSIDAAIAKQQEKMQSFGRLIAAQAAGAKIMRDSLPRQRMTIAGQARVVLLLPGRAGRKLGLKPGDVVMVQQEPPSPARAGEK